MGMLKGIFKDKANLLKNLTFLITPFKSYRTSKFLCKIILHLQNRICLTAYHSGPNFMESVIFRKCLKRNL